MSYLIPKGKHVNLIKVKIKKVISFRWVQLRTILRILGVEKLTGILFQVSEVYRLQVRINDKHRNNSKTNVKKVEVRIR